jgi:tetratricopeptide (TPR) repeat protein
LDAKGDFMTALTKKSGLILFLLTGILFTGTAVGAWEKNRLYLKDGSIIECDRVWRGHGDSVWYQKSLGTVGFPAHRVDLEKTFEIPARVKRLVDESFRSFYQKDWEAVIKATSEVIRLDRGNVHAYINRAGACNYKGDFEQAIEDCDRAIEINHRFPLAYNNRGHALESLGKIEEALLEYRKGCVFGSELACKNWKMLSSAK